MSFPSSALDRVFLPGNLAVLKGGAKVGKDRQLLTGAAQSPEMKKLLQGAK